MGRRAWIILALVVAMAAKGYTAQQYINDVRSGRQVACKYVKLAVDRHIRDLERAGSEEFPYYFDATAAKRVIDFKQQLRHTQGEWANPRKHDTRIHLEPWQQFKDWVLFGWRKLDGTRRFGKAYIEVARKNGKTTDAAATLNYHYFADRPREIGPQAYCVATKKDQAHIAWDEARRQVERHPILKSLSRVYKQNSTIILNGDSAAKCTVWGKDSGTQDGFNPSLALVDEAHAYPDNQMMEVIESGMGARQQPLIYIITTAGLDINAPCYQEERTLAVHILERTIDPVPENLFCLIYTLDDGDDWTDRGVWVKANPNIGVSLSWEYLEDRVQQGLQMPSRQNQILTKNFNIWTQSETRWIGAEIWEACDEPVDPAALAGRQCYAGLDLSTVIDITSYALVFPPLESDPFYRFLWRFFIPSDDLIDRERRDKVPYIEWVRRGLITTTPGNVIDYDFIEQRFLEDAKIYQIQEIGFDPWKAQEIVNHLTEGGLTMVPIQQRYSGMAAPTEEFERLVLKKGIAHGGNPVMTWMISCTEVKSDRQGNIMPMKPERHKSGKRIDGVVAAIMGLDRAQRNGGALSVYETRGVAVI
jgi:phage terminase large subunit-like protein